MKSQIYPLKLSALDRRLFRQAAKAESKSMAEWLREAGRERAKKNGKRRAACLDYPDYPLSREAERDKDYVGKRLRQLKGEPWGLSPTRALSWHAGARVLDGGARLNAISFMCH